MTERFKAFVPFILSWETEYEKGHYDDDNYVKVERDPDDPGGTTKYGIDQRSHPDVDVENLTKEQAIKIYYDEWVGAKIEPMSPKLGEVYFNACVNTGVSRANKLMVEGRGDAKFFLDAQEGFYRRLADQKSSFRKYLKGWLNRTRALREYLNIT